MVVICVTEKFPPAYALILQISLKGTCGPIIGSLPNADSSNKYPHHDIVRKFGELRFLKPQGLGIQRVTGKNCAVMLFINSLFGEISQIKWAPERQLPPGAREHKGGR